MPVVDNLTIIYDALNEYETFSPGDTITGKVILVLSKDTKAQRLYIKAKGDANVRWTRKSGDKTYTYHAHRRYFKLKHFLIPIVSSEDIHISRGSHEYPFRFTIPSQDMPPSFRAAHGSIVYKLEAVLARSWRMDHNVSKELKFAPKIVSNLQSLMAPQFGSTKKGMGLFSKGHVDMDVSINKRAYAPGETVVIAAKVNNSSSSDMTPKYSLIQSLVYSANTSTKHDSSVVYKMTDNKSIKPQTQTEVKCTMKIPDVMPTIQNCEIISVEYQIKVYLDVSFASDPQVVFPVDIIPQTLLSGHQSGGAVGPYPAGAIGGPSNSDFPPQAVGPYPSPFHPGFQSHSAPGPAYAPVRYPALPPHVAGGYSNPLPQQHGPYVSPFSSSSSTAVLHPPPSVPTFHPPPSAPEIQPQLPPSYDMSINAPPTHNLPPSAPMMNVDFLSQSDEAPPAYNFLFPPFAPEQSNSK